MKYGAHVSCRISKGRSVKDVSSFGNLDNTTAYCDERLITSSITANYNKETPQKAIITTIKTSSFL
jgi:hypothetical protein